MRPAGHHRLLLGRAQTWLYAAHNPALKAGVAWYGRIDGEVNDRTPKYPLDLAAS
jgi:carboxymethylenebutenolidase